MTRVHSFEELGAVMRKRHPNMKIAMPKQRTERVRKCKICGADMEHKEGTNIYVCHGEVPMVKDGEPVFIKDAEGNFVLDEQGNQIPQMEPCTNFAIGKA